MRTPENILDLANKAVRTVVRGQRGWSVEDWADMQQEGAAAICAMADDSNEAWCMRAAKNAIYDWMRIWLRSPRTLDLFSYLDYAGPSDPPWPLDYLGALPPLLTARRAKKVDEDMAYLRRRLRGISTAGIAMELGISERNVFAIRERLVPRLERIAQGLQ